MGIVNAGQLGVYDELAPELRERVEDVVLNRRPDAAERLVAFAETVKAQGKAATEDLAWRERHASRSACRTRWCKGITTYIVEDTEEARQKLRAADPGDRRPADGRHERRRRPVRRGQDVPAAGGEVARA